MPWVRYVDQNGNVRIVFTDSRGFTYIRLHIDPEAQYCNCDFCNGFGYVSIDGKYETCMKCYGKGYREIYK